MFQMDNKASKESAGTTIVGDIGGTNGRFALVTSTDHSHQPIITDFRTYKCQNYPSLSALLFDYLEDLGDFNPKRVLLAIAGPTNDRFGTLTNLNWKADAEKLESDLNLRRVDLLNDFEALAYATAVLKEPGVVKIKPGQADLLGPVSVMGPGTGFGVSLLIGQGRDRSVISTEGGHMRFAPVTPLERDLCEVLSDSLDHVSVETLLCGEGLRRLHQFIVRYSGSGHAELRPDQITAAAINKSDPACERAVQLFFSILGSTAGDLALAHGATGGVYLGGGILPKIAPLISTSSFNERFTDKGPMRTYLEDVPVHLIKATDAALIGAALAASFPGDES